VNGRDLLFKKDNIPKNYTLNPEEDAYIDEEAKER